MAKDEKKNKSGQNISVFGADSVWTVMLAFKEHIVSEYESLNRDSSMTEGGRAYQDKGLRETENEGRGGGWMSLSHDNCDLCFVRGCQLSRFWLSPIRPCRSYIKESVIIKTKVSCGKTLERFFFVPLQRRCISDCGFVFFSKKKLNLWEKNPRIKCRKYPLLMRKESELNISLLKLLHFYCYHTFIKGQAYVF